MKNLILIISTSFILRITYGQNIPNSGFEQWQGNDPVNWNTPNTFTSTYGIVTVTPETTLPYSGSYAVKMETKSLFGFNVPGFITLGQITINVQNPNPVTILGGVPFNQRPQYFEGYYKYLPSQGDNCIFQAFLLKRNLQTNAIDTIAKAIFTQNVATNEWTLFKTEFQYYSQETPDTIQINFSSSNPNAALVGSKLYIDNISVTGGSFISNIVFKENYYYYLENNYLNFVLNKNTNLKTINLYDITGKKVFTKHTYNDIVKIIVEKNNLYLYEILTEKNRFTGKILVL
ncbi:MAG: PCMD domain-containing protein [Bacteroidales bacterium]|nr:PCMD domain-containing protein [Bacteroidales bacterium]